MNPKNLFFIYRLVLNRHFFLYIQIVYIFVQVIIFFFRDPTLQYTRYFMASLIEYMRLRWFFKRNKYQKEKWSIF